MKYKAVAEVYSVTLSSGSYSPPYKENKVRFLVDCEKLPSGTKLYSSEVILKDGARIDELEDMLSRLVKENDLAMPNENYQWMYSPMRAECLKLLEDK